MITSNLNEIIAGFQLDKEEIKNSSDTLFREAVEKALEEFRQDVSGRRPDDMGLNVRTGTLRESIEAFSQSHGGAVTFALFNQRAEYWSYHQDGAGHNPKRLTWEEFWAHEMRERTLTIADRVLELA